MRIAKEGSAQHTADMDNKIDSDRMDEAERLAIRLFGDHAEEYHVIAVYDALAELAYLPREGVLNVH